MEIILSGYFGYSNLGDDLLLYQAIELFSTGNNLYIINPGPNIIETKYLRSKNVSILNIDRYMLLNKRYDFLIYSGGGLFPTLSYNIKNLLSNLRLSILVKHSIILGCGIVPKKGFFSNLYFKLFLLSCMDISVRDTVSKKYVDKLMNRSIENIGDLYFSRKQNELNKVSDNKNCLVCLCQPLIEKEMNDRILFRKYEIFLSGILDILYYFQEKGYKLTFMLFSKKYDSILIDNLIKIGLSPDISIIQEGVDFELSNVDSYISQYDIAFCMRYHSHVLCIRNNIPFVSICYDYKSLSLLDECNIRDVSVDFGIRVKQYFGKNIELNIPILKSKIDYVIAHQQELKNKMKMFSQLKFDTTNRYINRIKKRYSF